MVLPALREENLAKIEEENDKKFECNLAKSEREREKVEKLFEKNVWNSQRTVFKKPEIWCSIDRNDWSKNKFDQSNQAEAHRIFKARFRLIEN